MNSMRHWLSARTWVRIFGLAFIGLLAVTMLARVAHADGTINLPAGAYCATTQSGAVYDGVTAGACSATPPVTSCPSGRALTTVISHSRSLTGTRSVDATKADNLFGTFTSWLSPAPFPWDQGVFVGFTALKRGEYIAAQFTIPATGVNPATVGKFVKDETVAGPANIVTISQRCGDFNIAALPPNCVGTPVRPGDGIIRTILPQAIGVGCPLRPGQTYYLNIRIADPNVVHPLCGPVTCRFGLQSNHTP